MASHCYSFHFIQHSETKKAWQKKIALISVERFSDCFLTALLNKNNQMVFFGFFVTNDKKWNQQKGFWQSKEKRQFFSQFDVLIVICTGFFVEQLKSKYKSLETILFFFLFQIKIKNAKKLTFRSRQAGSKQLSSRLNCPFKCFFLKLFFSSFSRFLSSVFF